MDKVFISYRRDDSGGYARAIYQHLVMRFGPNAVFMDLETLQPGLDFVSQLRDILKSAKVVLVLIGKDWAGHAKTVSPGSTTLTISYASK
jgi:hypothetical protein